MRQGAIAPKAVCRRRGEISCVLPLVRYVQRAPISFLPLVLSCRLRQGLTSPDETGGACVAGTRSRASEGPVYGHTGRPRGAPIGSRPTWRHLGPMCRKPFFCPPPP